MTELQIVGHVCVDIAPGIGADVSLEPGVLSEIGAPRISVGGAVGNGARAAAGLGCDFAVACRIGRDALGDLCGAALEELAPGRVSLTRSDTAATSYRPRLRRRAVRHGRVARHLRRCRGATGRPACIGWSLPADHRPGRRRDRHRGAGIDALLLGDAEAVAAALVEADIVATAVGTDNLPPVAGVLAAGLEARARSGRGALDVLVCENLHDAPAVLMDLVLREARGNLAPVGMARTSVGRMVPIQVPEPGRLTDVRVEAYSLLPYEADALLCPPPPVPGLVPVEGDFGFYADRKLYLHNLGHCLLAYLGEEQGLTHIWEAVGRFDLRYLVRSAMVEAASALSLRYGRALGPLLDHVDDLLARFGNPGLGDTTARVDRDPVRKMQPGDRLLGAYLLCRAEGIAPRHVSLGVVLGARRLSQEPGWDADRAWALVRDAVGQDDSVALRALDEAVGGRFDGPRFPDLLDSGFRDGTVL